MKEKASRGTREFIERIGGTKTENRTILPLPVGVHMHAVFGERRASRTLVLCLMGLFTVGRAAAANESIVRH